MSASLDARVAAGRSVIDEAGRLVLKALAAKDVGITRKGRGDLVSTTDLAVERMAREMIGRAFPDDGFIGEEFGGAYHADKEFSWLIDPVDGTVNYARGIGYFCVSLALIRDGRPIAAWILDPERRELFYALPDGIMRLNDQPVCCATETDLGESVVGLGFSTRHPARLNGAIVSALTEAGAEHRRLGAGALCLAHVAAGRLEAYVEPHMNPWDAVGGLYLARCAGAVTLDYVGAGGLVHGAPVFAAAPGISKPLLALLPAPFSGAPHHLDNEPRSAGSTATRLQAFPNPETTS